MSYQDIVEKVSKEIDIPIEVVNLAYKSYWKFIKVTIQSLPLNEDISDEEFSKLRTNFNIPSIGKLSCTYERWIGVKKRLKYIKNLKKHVKDKKD